MKLLMRKSTLLIGGLLFVLSICNNNSFSQEVEWSPLQKKSGSFPQFYLLGENEFFGVVSNGRFAWSSSLKHYSNFTVDAEEKMDQKVNDKKSFVAGRFLVGNQLVQFLSHEDNDVQHLYYQKYSASCLPESAPVEILNYSNVNGKKYNNFMVVQSENRKFISVLFSLPNAKGENEKYGYKVLDEEFQVIAEGEYVSDHQSISEYVGIVYLSNGGHLYLGSKIYELNEKGKISREGKVEDFVVYRAGEDGIESLKLSDQKLQLNDLGLSDLSFISDENDILTFTGLYRSVEKSAQGAFVVKIDFNSGEVVSESYSEFDKDFITATWSDRAKKKANKREEKGKGAPIFYNYEFRDIKVMEDGSLMVAMEQFYIRVVTTTDSKGNTQTNYHYYYNDIIVFKVNTDNSFDWIQRIRKFQHSVNDGGYFSSYSAYFDKDNYVLFFNDNLLNYDANGIYMKEDVDRINNSTVSKNKNVVAKTEINLETGNQERKMFTTREETSSFCVPKCFSVDQSLRVMLLYFQTRSKEKFGILKF